ncbi:MAG: UDP-N-acetylmuramoyl-L-alanyl-D-glutamate--2,6-diaminopimelate ligase [Candidatus Marinimicrobia bacterium]|nr:UDP-N-acetylmuramoyl-L-alanyl-D-glutamate--2,6-diaminopimelate ligase [Candidatus Neomarinimicrobiota bacterium]
MQLIKLISALPEIVKSNGSMTCEISSLCHDSRKVKNNALFVAIRGLVSDGHDFIEQSISQGAAAIIYDRKEIVMPAGVNAVCVSDSRMALPILASEFFKHPEEKLKLIGITGTNGKTTTNYFIQHILYECGIKTGRIGTTGAEYQGITVDLIHTTPESNDLYEILSGFEQAGAEAVTLEVSSIAMDQNRVDGLQFDIAIFSNLTQDHLDYHTTFEEYLEAKQSLFKNLSTQALAIINGDDANSEKIIRDCPARIIRYGFGENCDYRILGQTVTNSGLELQIKTPLQSITIHANTIGKFNSYNLLSAIAAALESGCSLDLLGKAVQTLPQVPGRLEKMKNNAPFKVFVDYAHTPDAMETILRTLSEAYPGKTLTSVFGCGGDRDKGKRPIMGEIASRLSTTTIITDDNPRSEASMDIIMAIVIGCKGRNNFTIISDRRTAVLAALEGAGTDDVIAILGKGHEPYQEIKGERLPYSDMDIVNKFMEQHGYSA